MSLQKHLQFPTVNLNGTSQRDLLDQNIVAMSAIRKAIEAAQGACPNGRDFVPQGSPEATTALNAALAQHSDRLLRLRSVLIEFECIAEHVA